LSNDELLEILSEAKDPLAVQPFVKKCFEAVKELVFEPNGEISGMVSQEGEKITFTERVNPATSGVRLWDCLRSERLLALSVCWVYLASAAIMKFLGAAQQQDLACWPVRSCHACC
jgi:dynein heavy chain